MLKSIKYFIIFCLFVSTISLSQSVVGEWKNYTSALDMRDIKVVENKIYIATSGGLLSYSRDNDNFTKFKQEDGLSSISVQSIYQDKNGILWLGMEEGEINYYYPEKEEVNNNYIENYDYQNFKEKLDSIKVIQGNGQHCFAVCQMDMDWGVLHFYWKNGRWLYKDFYFSIGDKSSRIKDLYLGPETLFVATTSGLYYNETPLLEVSNLKSPNAWKKVQGTGGNIIKSVTGIDGNVYFSKDASLFRIEENDIQSLSKIEGRINSITGNNGKIILSGAHLVQVYKVGQNGDLKLNYKKVLKDTEIKKLASVNNTVYGITKTKGLFQYRSGDKNIEFYKPNTLLNAGITSLYSDRENEIIAASKKGFSILKNGAWYNLIRTRDYEEPFKGETISEMDPEKFSAGSLAYHISNFGKVWSIDKREDKIYGSLHRTYINGERKGGLISFNPDKPSEYVVYDTTNNGLPSSEGIANGNENYLVPSVAKVDQRGNLWLASWYAHQGKVISVLDKEEEWHHFTLEESGHRLTQFICDLEFGPKGNVWFVSKTTSLEPGSKGGIVQLDYDDNLENKDDDEWERYSTTSGVGLKNNSVFSIDFDRSGMIWILTSEGVQKGRINNGAPNFYQFSNGNRTILTNVSFSDINKIRADKDGNIWVTSTGDGVRAFSKEGEWLPFDKAVNDTIDSLDVAYGFTKNNSGLMNNTINDITFNEEKGKVYFATQEGISVLKYRYPAMKKEYDKLKVFPSPFIIPRHQKVVIDGLLENSSVKIMTITGELVRKIDSDNSMIKGRQVHWDGRDQSGNFVGSGVYVILAYNNEGRSQTAKIAIMRK